MKSVYKMPTVIGMKTMCHMTTKWIIYLVIYLIFQTGIVYATFNTTYTFGTVYNTTTFYNFEILNNVVTTVDTATPMLLNMDQNDTFLTVFGGQGRHYIGLTADGKSLIGYGDNELGQLGLGNQILAVNRWTSIVNVSTGIRLVGVGYSHSVFLTNDNQLFIMGSNDYGEVGEYAGNGPFYTPINPPQDWMAALPTADFLSETVQICGGYHTTHFVQKDGSVWGMGYNELGTLGIGTTTNSRMLQKTIFPDFNANISTISCSWLTVLAIDVHSNIVWSWGDNTAGKLGTGSDVSRLNYASIPVKVDMSQMQPFLQPNELIIDVQNGKQFSLLLTKVISNSSDNYSSQIFSWGALQFLGNNEQVLMDRNSLTPYPIDRNPLQFSASMKVAQLKTGASHSLILTSTGQLFGFGGNSHGQLAQTITLMPQLSPIAINTPVSFVYRIAAGESSSLTLNVKEACFGFLASDPHVCSGQGACIKENQCVCNACFYGSYCQYVFDSCATIVNITSDIQSPVLTYRGSPITLTAYVTPNSYFALYPATPLVYHWATLNDTELTNFTMLDTNANTLYIPAGFLPRPSYEDSEFQLYIFAVRVYPEGNADAVVTKNGTSQIALVIQPRQLIARIAEGSVRSIPLLQFANLNFTITLDVIDLDNADEGLFICSWTCEEFTSSTSRPCSSELFPQNLNDACQLTLNYANYVNYSSDASRIQLNGKAVGRITGRSAEASATLSIENQKNRNSPALSFATSPRSKITAQEKFILVVNTLQPEGDEREVYYKWECTYGGLPLTSQTLESNLDAPSLIVKPNMMSSNFYYTFRLTASYTPFPNQTALTPLAFIEHTVYIVAPPTITSFTITPKSGTALTTMFILKAAANVPSGSSVRFTYEIQDPDSGNFYSISDQPSVNPVLENVALPQGPMSAQYAVTLRVKCEQYFSNVQEEGEAPLVAYQEIQATVLPPTKFIFNPDSAVSQSLQSVQQKVLLKMNSVASMQIFSTVYVQNYYGAGNLTSFLYLFNSLIDLIDFQLTNGQVFHEAQLSKVLKIISDLKALTDNNAALLTMESYQTLLSLMTNVLNTINQFENSMVQQQFIDFYSNMQAIYYTLLGDLLSKVELSYNNKSVETIFPELSSNWYQILSLLRAQLVFGGPDFSSTASTVSLHMGMRQVRTLPQQQFIISNTRVSLPQKLNLEQLNKNHVLSFEIIKHSVNPYVDVQDPLNYNLSSYAVSFTLYDPSLYEPFILTGHNLQEPLLIDIPLLDMTPAGDVVQELIKHIDMSPFTSNGPKTKLRIRCRYFEEKTSSWSTSGCEYVELAQDNTTVVCACYHTTTYAVFIEEDTMISHTYSFADMITSFLVVMFVSLGYLFAGLLIIVGLYYIQFRIDGMKDKDDQANDESEDHRLFKSLAPALSKLRMLGDHICRHNPYIGFAFLPRFSWKYKKQKNYSRVQRFLVVFTTVFIIFCVNAIVYGSTAQNSVFILGSVISLCIAVPISLVIEQLFIHSEKRKERILNILSVPPVYGREALDLDPEYPANAVVSDNLIAERETFYFPSFVPYLVYALAAIISLVCEILIIAAAAGIFANNTILFNLLDWFLASFFAVILDALVIRMVWVLISAIAWRCLMTFYDTLHEQNEVKKLLEEAKGPPLPYLSEAIEHVISNTRRDVSEEEAIDALKQFDGDKEKAIELLKRRRENAQNLKEETGCAIQEAIKALAACNDDMEDARRYIAKLLSKKPVTFNYSLEEPPLNLTYVKDVMTEEEKHVMEILNDNQEENMVTLDQVRYVLKKKEKNVEEAIQYLGDLRLVWMAADCPFDEAVEALDSTNDVFEAVEFIRYLKDKKRTEELLKQVNKHAERFKKEDVDLALEVCQNNTEKALIYLMEISQIMEINKIDKDKALQLYESNNRKLFQILSWENNSDMVVEQVNTLLKAKRLKSKSKQEITHRLKYKHGIEETVEHFSKVDRIKKYAHTDDYTAKRALEEVKNVNEAIKIIRRRPPPELPRVVSKSYREICTKVELKEQKETGFTEAINSFTAVEVLNVLRENGNHIDSTIQYLDAINTLIQEARVNRLDAVSAYKNKKGDVKKCLEYLKEKKLEDAKEVSTVTGIKLSDAEKLLSENRFDMNQTIISIVQQKPKSLPAQVSEAFDNLAGEAFDDQVSDYLDACTGEELVHVLSTYKNNKSQVTKYLTGVRDIMEQTKVSRKDAIDAYYKTNGNINQAIENLLSRNKEYASIIGEEMSVDSTHVEEVLILSRFNLEKAKVKIYRTANVGLPEHIVAAYETIVEKVEREEKLKDLKPDSYKETFTCDEIVKVLEEENLDVPVVNRYLNSITKIIQTTQVPRAVAIRSYRESNKDVSAAIQALRAKEKNNLQNVIEEVSEEELYKRKIRQVACETNCFEKDAEQILELYDSDIKKAIKHIIESQETVMKGTIAFSTRRDAQMVLSKTNGDTKKAIDLLNNDIEQQIKAIEQRERVSRADAIEAINFFNNPDILRREIMTAALMDTLGYTKLEALNKLQEFQNNIAKIIEQEIAARAQTIETKLEVSIESARRALEFSRAHSISEASEILQKELEEEKKKKSILHIANACSVSKEEAAKELDNCKGDIEKTIQLFKEREKLANNEKERRKIIQRIAETCNVSLEDAESALELYKDEQKAIEQVNLAINNAKIEQIMKKLKKYNTEEDVVRKALKDSNGDTDLAISNIKKQIQKVARQDIKEIASECNVSIEEAKEEYRKQNGNKAEAIKALKETMSKKSNEESPVEPASSTDNEQAREVDENDGKKIATEKEPVDMPSVSTAPSPEQQSTSDNIVE